MSDNPIDPVAAIVPNNDEPSAGTEPTVTPAEPPHEPVTNDETPAASGTAPQADKAAGEGDSDGAEGTPPGPTQTAVEQASQSSVEISSESSFHESDKSDEGASNAEQADPSQTQALSTVPPPELSVPSMNVALASNVTARTSSGRVTPNDIVSEPQLLPGLRYLIEKHHQSQSAMTRALPLSNDTRASFLSNVKSKAQPWEIVRIMEWLNEPLEALLQPPPADWKPRKGGGPRPRSSQSTTVTERPVEAPSSAPSPAAVEPTTYGETMSEQSSVSTSVAMPATKLTPSEAGSSNVVSKNGTLTLSLLLSDGRTFAVTSPGAVTEGTLSRMAKALAILSES